MQSEPHDSLIELPLMGRSGLLQDPVRAHVPYLDRAVMAAADQVKPSIREFDLARRPLLLGVSSYKSLDCLASSEVKEAEVP